MTKHERAIKDDDIQHTPGPWTLTWSDFERKGSRFNIDHFSAGASGNVVLGDGMRGPRGLANARLIAKAPELYAALAACVARLEHWPGTENPELFPEMREARRLLQR